MEININKIKERLNDEFPSSHTNLIIRDSPQIFSRDCYTIELIVDNKHVRRSVPKDEFNSLSKEVSQFYLEGMFNNLITTMKEDQNDA